MTTEIKLGETTFRIKKMLPIEAKRVFMNHVRPLLKGALSAQVNEEAQTWQILLAAFTDAPQEHYDALVQEMYRHIEYVQDGTTSVLFRDEENAFKDLDMSDIIELDVMAFQENFQKSLTELGSKLQRLVQNSKLF